MESVKVVLLTLVATVFAVAFEVFEQLRVTAALAGAAERTATIKARESTIELDFNMLDFRLNLFSVFEVCMDCSNLEKYAINEC